MMIILQVYIKHLPVTVGGANVLLGIQLIGYFKCRVPHNIKVQS